MLSQSGEDKVLISIFSGVCDGKYVELGALDGLTYSNTYAFNQDMGWRGILIEPSPTSFSSLRANRANEISLVHAAVCKERSQLHFIDQRNAIAGLWEFSSPSFRERFWPGVLREHGTPVYCLPMSDIILTGSGQSSHFFADFLSLDVEGGELQVLESLNFNVTAFGVVIVEADGSNATKDQLVRDLLEANGYSYMGPIKQNDWFTNDQWDEI
jgi:FkbM family methyltransferase